MLKNQKQIFESIGNNANDIIELTNFVLNHLNNYKCENVELLSAKKQIMVNLALLKGLSGLFESTLSKYKNNVESLTLLVDKFKVLQQPDGESKNSLSNRNNKLIVNKFGRLEEY